MTVCDHPQLSLTAPSPLLARHPYRGRRAALATMHGKQSAIAPPLQQHLDLAVELATGVDTDRFGTFTGEVPRRHDAMTIAIAKARAGMEATGLSLGLASEGSFGPHPQIPFAAAGVELIVLVDDDADMVVAESIVDDGTNFLSAPVRSLADAERLLGRTRFPSHALTVVPHDPLAELATAAGQLALCFKSLRDLPTLEYAIGRCAAASPSGEALLATDMRAHMNPTRMAAIRRLAARLAERIAVLCPDCGAPGFGLMRTVPGLPCRSCQTPTTYAASEVHQCQACQFELEQSRADGLQGADPINCPSCNP